MAKRKIILRESDKKQALALFAVFIIAILLILSLYNLLFGRKNDAVIDKPSTPPGVELKDDSIEKSKEQIELERLQAMTERARIEYYATKFMNYIETSNYTDAYTLLNQEFRKNYFSSSEAEFKKYCEETFPSMMDVNYTNIERNGDVYVLWLTITDAINGEKDSGKEFNIVVKENNYNDFELSFSKK